MNLETETLFPCEHTVDPPLLVRRRRVKPGKSLGKPPETIVATDTVLDKKPLECFSPT
jgi:hypothetical protein